MSRTLAEWLDACPTAITGDAPPPGQRGAFAALLEQFRERADLSRNALARLVGIDPSYVSRLELGKREPPRRPLVLALANALALDAADRDRLLLAGGYAPPWLMELAGVARITPQAVAS